MKQVSRARRGAFIGLLMAVVASVPQGSLAGLGSEMDGGRWVRFDWEHTSFENYENGFFDANWLVEGRVSLGSGIGLRAELPIVRASIPAPSMSKDTQAEIAVGNLFLGVDIPQGSGGGVWELGVWVPTSSGAGPAEVMALGIAASADFVRGLERFSSDTAGVLAMLHRRENLGPRLLGLRWDIGASIADLGGRDIEPFLLAGGRVVVSLPTGTALAIGLDTRMAISDLFDDFASTDVVIEVESRILPIVSAVQLRRPLDADRADILNWTLGLSIKMSLP